MLLGGRKVALLEKQLRHQRIGFTDQPGKSGALDFVHMLLEHRQGGLTLAFGSPLARKRGTQEVCHDDFVLGQALTDDIRDRPVIGRKLVEVLQRFEAVLSCETARAQRRVFGKDPVGILGTEPVLPDLVVERSRDDQTVLPKFGVAYFIQHGERDAELAKAFFEPACDRIHVDCKRTGTKPHIEVSGSRERACLRDRFVVVAEESQAVRLKVREVLPLGGRGPSLLRLGVDVCDEMVEARRIRAPKSFCFLELRVDASRNGGRSEGGPRDGDSQAND